MRFRITGLCTPGGETTKIVANVTTFENVMAQM